MQGRVKLLMATYFVWVAIFVLQKPLFLIAFAGGVGEVLPVIGHGLPLDFSMAGYLTAVYGLVLLVNSLPPKLFRSQRSARWLGLIVQGWTVFCALAVSLAFVANMALYGYWRFPLDSTPLFFITSSPRDAFASVTWWQGALGVAGCLVTAAAVYLCFRKLWKSFGVTVFRHGAPRWQWISLLLLDAFLFLPIRGGVTVSTMNTGKAYFSNDQTLNHAAVNPLFSFLESVSHEEDFAGMYRFMDDKTAHRLASGILPKPVAPAWGGAIGNASSMRVLKDGVGGKLPDIYIVIMESFSDTLTRQPHVAPNLNSLKQSGIYFSRFYANGYRTDRGMVSILLGYPAPGAVSLMKYPRKTAALPSLAAHLNAAGYHSRYYYGGDADFTNMRSFLVNQGIGDITEDVDFPIAQRLSKWGVPDHLLFERAKRDISGRKGDEPLFTVIQTSSSHEPFDVPYHRLNDKVLNAFAYADSCVGSFVNYLKQTPRWQRSLVILVPDHLGAWPEVIDNFKSWRFHVPMIWVGGAVRKPMVVDTYGSQQDIAATLLGQLNIPHADMPYSKDLFDPRVIHYAYFMMNDGFGMVDADNELIYDNRQRRVMVDKGAKRGKNLRLGQALLQVLFDDIAKR